jgi:hypothetical protein
MTQDREAIEEGNSQEARIEKAGRIWAPNSRLSLSSLG